MRFATDLLMQEHCDVDDAGAGFVAERGGEVRAGKASALAYHMARRQMDPAILSSYSGIARLRIRWHMRPGPFARLPETLLRRYAEALHLSVEELKRVPEDAGKLVVLEGVYSMLGDLAPLDELMADEELRDAGLFEWHHHPTEGDILVSGIAIRFTRTAGSVKRLAPGLDEHREEILREVEATRQKAAQAAGTRRQIS